MHRTKVTESSQTQELPHVCDLEELFPGNQCILDMSYRNIYVI